MISNLIFTTLITLGVLTYCSGQSYNSIYFSNAAAFNISWCAVGTEERAKCDDFAKAVANDKTLFKSDYLGLNCVQGYSKEDCMSQIERDIADVTSLDAGELFVAGRYFSIVPILQEFYEGNKKNYYAVAVIKKGSLPDVRNLRHLRGKKACFAGVGTLAGWFTPISVLMEKGNLEVVDCNNHVKNAITYFGPSCAVNSLLDKYNPIGDNSDKLCQLCSGSVAGERCSSADPYAGYSGAFRCLVEAGDVAFIKHTTALEIIERRIDFPTLTKDEFELLCLDGSRRPVDSYETCNWGTLPTHAIVVSSVLNSEKRRMVQKFFQRAVDLYGAHSDQLNSSRNDNFDINQYNSNTNRNYYQNRNSYTTTTLSPFPLQPEINKNMSFKMFDSAPYYGSKYNLMFQDVTDQLIALDEGRQTFSSYLGDNRETILSVRKCPVGTMTLCVTSEPEFEKCHKMRIALKAQLLKPEMVCYKAHSHMNCMQAIKKGYADVAVMDAGDIYEGGLRYDLIPIMSEVYNLGIPEYYVVAVSREDDPDTELTYLTGKYSCHPGINFGAGWIIPMAYLTANGWIRSYGCNSVRAAAEYFSKSCVPGANSPEYNTGVPYENLCGLCHGTTSSTCRRDASEDFFGYTGAFRCLVEGGGDVAFLKHTTVLENTDGKRVEWWARNTLQADFQLLCPDGTRMPIHKFRECNLGRVKSNAIVTRGGEGYNEAEINAYINLFIYAQQFYGRKDYDEFNFAMFHSKVPYSDLIFQDSTTKLQVIEPSQRYFSTYLGKDFMRAKRIVDCFAGGNAKSSSTLLVTLCVIVITSLISLWS